MVSSAGLFSAELYTPNYHVKVVACATGQAHACKTAAHIC